jgi:hypothetical protein
MQLKRQLDLCIAGWLVMKYLLIHSLNLPEYLNKISFDKNNKYNTSVKVIGFNSKKFDINIFVNHIIDSSIHTKSVIGTETQYKSLILNIFQIQFLDLKSLLAEGDLDKYVTKFAKIFEKKKGVFPYEFLSIENYKELSSSISHVEYLEWYNTQNVFIMCSIIDFLIHKFQEYDIDMLHNLLSFLPPFRDITHYLKTVKNS